MTDILQVGTVVLAAELSRALIYLGGGFWMWHTGRIELLRGFTEEIVLKGSYGPYTVDAT